MFATERDFCMYNITVGRMDDHPEAQGVVKPADGSWQLVIDNEGFPHLWVRVKGEDDTTGMVPLDMFLQEGCGVKDLMLSTFGGEVTDPAEIEACMKEWVETKQKLGIPCPV